MRWGLLVFISVFITTVVHAKRKMPGHNPAIYLILESKKDMRFVKILTPLCDVYGIKLFLIENY